MEVWLCGQISKPVTDGQLQLVHHKWLAPHQRLPCKLTAFQHHTINLCQLHDHLLGKMGETAETPVLSFYLTNITTDIKGPQLLLTKTKGNEEPKINMTLDTSVILKRKNLQKKNFLVELQTNKKGWMTKLMTEDSLKHQLLLYYGKKNAGFRCSYGSHNRK